MQMNSLTAPLLRELIDHVDIFETEDTGKSRTQRIAIYCRFVGHAEIPDALRKPHKTKEQVSYLLIHKTVSQKNRASIGRIPYEYPIWSR